MSNEHRHRLDPYQRLTISGRHASHQTRELWSLINRGTNDHNLATVTKLFKLPVKKGKERFILRTNGTCSEDSDLVFILCQLILPR